MPKSVALSAVLLIVLCITRVTDAADREVPLEGDTLNLTEQTLLRKLIGTSLTLEPKHTAHVTKLDFDGDGVKDFLVQIKSGPDWNVGLLIIARPDRLGQASERFAAGALVLATTLPASERARIIAGRTDGRDEIMVRAPENGWCAAFWWGYGSLNVEEMECTLSAEDYLQRRSECVTSGDRYEVYARKGRCIRSAKDAGKTCRDRSDCEFDCVHDLARLPKDNQNAVGYCAPDDDRYSYKGVIRDGRYHSRGGKVR